MLLKWKQEKLHMENDIEASVVTSMEMLAGYDKWRIKKKIKLTPLDNMKATLENLGQKVNFYIFSFIN